jgi:hypothetical protein
MWETRSFATATTTNVRIDAMADDNQRQNEHRQSAALDGQNRTQELQTTMEPESHPELKPINVPFYPILPAALGYPGNSRFVAFYWTPSGEEVIYDDGKTSGTGDTCSFRVYLCQTPVAKELKRYNLGDSYQEAEHWLLFDTRDGKAGILPAQSARQFLCRQHPNLTTPHS